MTSSDGIDSVHETVLAILADYLDVPVAELTSERSLEGVGADSLDFLQIVFEIEEKLAIEIVADGPELRKKLQSIGDVLRVTSELVAQKNG
jgi:acyl carrier protein